MLYRVQSAKGMFAQSSVPSIRRFKVKSMSIFMFVVPFKAKRERDTSSLMNLTVRVKKTLNTDSVYTQLYRSSVQLGK